MGKKLVFQFRGCDIRDREENIRLNPGLNACQECNYPEHWCRNSFKDRMRRIAKEFGNLFLVTTPDLKDFFPGAIHLPFLIPEMPGHSMLSAGGSRPKDKNRHFRIIHVTNHEGIDGTRYIVEAVNRLKVEGYEIELIIPRQVPFQEMLRLYPTQISLSGSSGWVIMRMHR